MSRHSSSRTIVLALLVSSTVLLSPPSGHAAPISGPDSGLAGWWTLDEGVGNTAGDASGNQHPATLANGAVWTAGRIGSSALSFDGINDHAAVTNFTALNGAPAATVALWCHPRTANGPIVSQWNVGRLFEFDGFQTGMTVFWRYGGSGGGGGTLRHQTTPGSLALNQWQHLVFVYNSPTASTYVNGILVGSASGAGGALNTNVNDPLRVGWNNLPGYLNGLVDDVRVYSRALSVAEIQELYHYTGDSTPPSVAMSSPAVGSMVSGSVTVSASASDNVGVAGVQFRLDGVNLGVEDTAAPYSVSWDTTATVNGSHTLTAMARDVANNQTASAPVSVTVSNAAVILTGPVGWWTFDEGVGTTAGDASGNEHPATLTSGAAWTAGRIGASAVSLDGIDGHVLVANFTALSGAQAGTVALWCYPRAANGPLISQWNVGRLFEFDGFQDGMTVSWQYGGSGGGGATLAYQTSPGSLVLNQWQHVVFVYNNPTASTYVNGVPVGSASGAGGPLNTGVNDPLSIGGNDLPACLNGNVDDVRVYSRALSVAEIQQLYNDAGDFTPPSVSISSPTDSSTVSGSITVSASASDAVGVAGVQFRLDGFDLGVEDTVAPYSVSWDTTATVNGSHTLTAVARDVASNQTASAPVSVTVSNPIVMVGGPVGWWTFDEGVGSTAGDASGNQHPATLVNGATWTTGRIGSSALSFDGINDHAAVTNFTGLNGAQAATVALWCHPRTANGPIISQWNVGRLLEVDGFQSGMTIYWRYGGSGSAGRTLSYQTRPGSLALNQWQHLVFVYSNPTASTYANGVLVGSASGVGGPLNTNINDPLRIGWNNLPTYLSGMVDDVQVYNRALSAAEIQELYNYAGDFTPPTVSISSPTGGSTVSGSVTMAASASDNVGVAGVQFRLDGFDLGAEDTVAPYSVSWNTTSAANGAHTLTALARDVADNQTTSAPVAVTVSNTVSDTTPPSISNGAPSGLLPVGTIQVTLSLTTSENATCRYSTSPGTAYAAMTGVFSTTGGTSHSTTVSGLANGQTYTYYLRAQDTAGNVTASDYLISFSVAVPGSDPSIVIDHSSVDLLSSIPDSYISLIKSQRMIASYLGGSHARQMHYGLALLAAQDSRYAAAIAYNPNSFPNADALRDLSGKYTIQYNSWSEGGGADTYWQNDAARQILINTMQRIQTVLGYPVRVSLFGWSYHMTSPTYATSVLGHPMSDADVQLYLDALSSFNNDPTINATVFVYHTSVTDGSRLSDNTSFDMNRWNDMIRQAAASQAGVLFDQADIEFWNNSNTARLPETDYAGRTVYRRHPDYQEASLGGPGPDTYTSDHGNDAIEIRKAKALWVLLARLAGWDGIPQLARSPAGVSAEDRSLRVTGELLPSAGAVLLEFATTADRAYHVQFSSDLRNWKTVRPAIIGTGSRVQWRDAGSPGTDSVPGGQARRFYRVVLAP